MMKAMQEDWDTRFKKYVESGEMCLQMAYAGNKEEAEEFKKEVQAGISWNRYPYGSTFFKRCMPYRTWSTCCCMRKESNCIK